VVGPASRHGVPASADVADVRARRRLLPLIAAAVLPVALVAQPPAVGATGASGGQPERSGTVPSASRCSSRSDLLNRPPVVTWHLARGLAVRAWDGTDGRGHEVRLTVAQADVARIRLAAAAVARHGDVAPTTGLTRAVHAAVAGVNGDYFGYDWSGAAVPAGPVVVGGRVLRLPAGAHPAVGTDRSGRPFTGLVRVDGEARLPIRSGSSAATRVLPIASVNDDGGDEGGQEGADAVGEGRAVAVVTRYLGNARPRREREVVLRAGVVVASGRRVSFGSGRTFGSGRSGRNDVLLAADGAAAKALRAVPRGSAIRVRFAPRAADGSTPAQAVGSGGVMLRRGRVLASCSGASAESRPRTLVAWNAARTRVWLLTVDGRGKGVPVSRFGAPYRQVAELARTLGASDAVMLDGGGSTTMALWGSGGVRRVDAPAWTPQRPVPNGLVLISR
jgi:hypothetical protein